MLALALAEGPPVAFWAVAPEPAAFAAPAAFSDPAFWPVASATAGPVAVEPSAVPSASALHPWGSQILEARCSPYRSRMCPLLRRSPCL